MGTPEKEMCRPSEHLGLFFFFSSGLRQAPCQNRKQYVTLILHPASIK